jgi:putative two-component system response regulator
MSDTALPADVATDRPLSLLIVDDLEGNVRLLHALLERDGAHVAAAADGEEAIAAVGRLHPDVVLMDVMMPRLDGIEACRRLKHDPATRLTPVVLVTARQDGDSRVRGIEAGADDFIVKPFNVHELRARVRSLARIKRYTDELDSAEAVIVSLAATIEARDEGTIGHCERLARYGVALGAAIGLDEEDRRALARGGYLHDLGKIGVPDRVLLKRGPLDAGERALIEQHTVIGDRLCGDLRALTRVRPIVRHHHERLDGSGYPDGLRGDDVPLLAQIVGIVDVFDALITERPYKPALSIDEACRALEDEARRGWRRHDLVEQFVALVRDTPLVESCE